MLKTITSRTNKFNRYTWLIFGLGGTLVIGLNLYRGFTDFTQMTLNGVVLGFNLMLVALGLTLVFGILNVINLAHGELYMIGGYITWYFTVEQGINYWLAIFIAMILVATLGVLLERVILRHFRINLMAGMVAGIGLIFILNSTVLVWLDQANLGFGKKVIPQIVSGVSHFGGVSISNERLLVLFLGIALVAAVIFFILRTSLGRAMRAVAQDEEVARLQGINVNVVFSVTMAIGAALAAIGGGLLGATYWVGTDLGFPMLLKSFIAIVLGGMGSVPGILAAALILGMIESYTSTLISGQAAYTLLFLMLCLILIIRPGGIAGQVVRE
ncbi:branched-chain amino acid ABC transporter permease [Chloroflexota bacterium]